MSDSNDKHPLYRGPASAAPGARRGPRPPRPPRHAEPDERRPPRPRRDEATAREPAADMRPGKPKESRIYGLNACLAAFRKRPQDIRKLWLLESRIPKLQELLAFCVKHRIGYNVVDGEDLDKLTASAHHEGVCLALAPVEEVPLSTWLMGLPDGPVLAIWLDGVGNPHNLGAILRSAAHFGVQGVLLPKHSALAVSGAAARVAEGGAEHVPLVRLGREENAVAQLQSAGFVLASTVVRDGQDVFETALPPRCVLVMGAEQSGVGATLRDAGALKLEIPGSGQVESLNVAAATAVLLAEWRRQNR